MFVLFGASEKRIERWVEKGKINRVLRAVDSNNPDIRKAAITALGQFEQEEAFHKLVGILRDPDAEIRELVAKALGVQANPSAVEHLRYLISNDDDENVRKAATESVKMIDTQIDEEEDF